MSQQPESRPISLDSTPKKVAVHTLGCKLNFSESATIAEQFTARGYQLTDSIFDTDILILNTCSVTNNAEREGRQIVRRVLRRSPNTFIAVTGCYAQLRPEEIASIKGVDIVLGAKEKFSIFKHLSDFGKRSIPLVLSDSIEEATDFYIATSSGSSSRTRAFLKVQDGCDYNCSFCTIPEARGASRSGEIEQIVDQAIQLCESGYREIVLSGVNVGDFGSKTGNSFLQLVQTIENEERITARIRISSIEPNLLKDEIIELIAGSRKFCPHFHIPLQSGSSKILKLMQRRYNLDLYRSRIEKIKSLMPHACIGADVIVGFPSETDLDAQETYRFIESLDLSYLHVFTYSERPGTKAAAMTWQIDPQARYDRNEILRRLSEHKLRAFYESQMGALGEVILENKEIACSDGAMLYRTGHTSNYVRVRLNSEVDSTAQRVRVVLREVDGEYMVGEILDVLAEEISHSLQLPVLA